MKHILTAFCLIALLTVTTLASDLNGNANFMPLEQVRPGMKGHGMSVFQGSKPERFEVEVLGTLKGMPNPKQAIVIARPRRPACRRCRRGFRSYPRKNR